MKRLLFAIACCLLPVSLHAQSGGTVAGRVRDAATNQPLEGALVRAEGTGRSAVTDTAGEYRLREVTPGWVRIRTLRLGYRALVRDSVLVRAGETVRLDMVLQRVRDIDTLQAIDVVSAPDVVLDPLATSTTQRITGEDIRRLPVSSLDEAIALSAGAVGSSYRGGRFGQESFILDGLQVKNQLDASTGGLGLRFPPDILTEAALVTNGFSARYGQALSGMINVVTKDGGEEWSGRMAYESDRLMPASADYGLDRFVIAGDGPLFGGVTMSFAADATGRLDADPVNAPAPLDPRDPRSARPNMLPHNSGEQYDLAGKVMIPVGSQHTLRLFGVGSMEQRLLYDPALKYDIDVAPGRRVVGRLVGGHWQYGSRGRAQSSMVADLRVAHFRREFARGPLRETPDGAFGAFTLDRLDIRGEDIARAQDTAAAGAPLPGYVVPEFSENTPWGVPAFFMGRAGRGELAWNAFSELRTQLDLNFGGREADLYVGGELVRQRVQTFSRVLGHLPVGDSVPAATASDFKPTMFAGYAEGQMRWQDLAFTVGLRMDRYEPNTTIGGAQGRSRTSISPRLGISTVLAGATVVVSYGRFSQAPDYQYLVDAAFDDTTRTGRFRAGNPALGYENSTQYEFSLRARPKPGFALRVNAYVKRLTGLVASVPFGLDPDSTIFGNTDHGNVIGGEFLFEREYRAGWGARVMVSAQRAMATATNAFQLFRRIRLDPTGDTVRPASVDFPLDYDRRLGLTAVLIGRINDSVGPSFGAIRPLGGLEASAIVRASSGLPYSRTNVTGDTLIGLPNSHRLPSQLTIDMLVRRPFRILGRQATLYADVRNIANRRNIIAVRRDTGTPGLGDAGADAAAQQAFNAHPEAIPYESPRYRPGLDADGNGLIEGPELLTAYQAAARDFFQPLFAYGQPRLIRLGAELLF